jgi:hypothetical protein
MFVLYLLRFGLGGEAKLSVFFMLALSSLLAALFHGAFLFLPAFAVWYVLLSFFSNRLTMRSLATYVMVLVAVVGIGALFFLLQIGASKVGAVYAASGEAIYDQVVRIASAGMMKEYANVLAASPPIYAALAIGKFAFSPFFSDQLRAFDIVRMPLVILLFISLINVVRKAFPYALAGVRPSFLVLSALLLTYCFLFSIGSVDPDTAFRHYIKLLPVMLAAGFPIALLYSRRERGTAVARDGALV